MKKGDTIKCMHDGDPNITFGKLYTCLDIYDHSKGDTFVYVIDDNGMKVDKFRFKFEVHHDILPEELFQL